MTKARPAAARATRAAGSELGRTLGRVAEARGGGRRAAGGGRGESEYQVLVCQEVVVATEGAAPYALPTYKGFWDMLLAVPSDMEGHIIDAAT